MILIIAFIVIILGAGLFLIYNHLMRIHIMSLIYRKKLDKIKEFINKYPNLDDRIKYMAQGGYTNAYLIYLANQEVELQKIKEGIKNGAQVNKIHEGFRGFDKDKVGGVSQRQESDGIQEGRNRGGATSIDAKQDDSGHEGRRPVSDESAEQSSRKSKYFD
jgi:hypothetical protein